MRKIFISLLIGCMFAAVGCEKNPDAIKYVESQGGQLSQREIDRNEKLKEEQNEEEQNKENKSTAEYESKVNSGYITESEPEINMTPTEYLHFRAKLEVTIGLDESTCAKDFEYWINYCYSLYNKQANKVIFNLLDSHDIDRLLTRSKSYDKFLQQLAVLFTMPGSPCIYYGTELGLEGENDPYNRLPMPWDKVNSPDALKTYQAVKALIALRKAEPSLLGTVIEWHVNSQDRTIWYTRTGDGDKAPINVVINANTTDIKIDPKVNQILYSYKYQASTLEAGGFIIYR